MTLAVEARDLAVGYRRHPVLTGVDLRVAGGELVCLLGANGSGKSTLLRTLVGVQAPLAGEVRIGGEPLARMSRDERARRVAVVLTEPLEAGLLTARDVVALGRYPHTDWTGRLRPADDAAVDRALRATGTWGFADRRVTELSDGERQRVMIARALAQEPELVVLDEPTAFLDVTGRVEVTLLLRELAADRGIAVLASTHDLHLALRTADRLLLVDRGGRLVGGTGEELLGSGVLAATFDRLDVALGAP